MRWIALLCLACSAPAVQAPPPDPDPDPEPEGPLDRDADARVDADDMCPCDAEDLDSFEDDDGCPDEDNDGDRLVDACDICPNDAETWNGSEDLDGCPDRGGHMLILGVAHEGGEQIRILEMVRFDKDSAQIRPDSMQVIEAVAQALAQLTEITLVEVQGHCSTGERRPDQLSLRRAEAIRDALVQRGVDPGRLSVRGWGENQPIESNDTPALRARNRRGEFRILEHATPRPDPRNPCPNGPPPRPPSACN